MHRYFVIVEAVGRHRQPAAGFAAGQLDIVQVHGIDEPAYRQAAVVGVVDAKAQQKLLFQQPRLDDLDLRQLDARIAKLGAEPGGATAQQAEKTQQNHGV
ncbi:hypothetical protein D3C77_666380 [compost metagenome]